MNLKPRAGTVVARGIMRTSARSLSGSAVNRTVVKWDRNPNPSVPGRAPPQLLGPIERGPAIRAILPAVTSDGQRFLVNVALDESRASPITAVLQANYIIDCGLRGNAAMRAFQDQSVGLIESVRTFGQESSKRLGLSYRRQEKDSVDPAKPFGEVGEDLRHLMLAMPAEVPVAVAPGEPPAMRAVEALGVSEQTALADKNAATAYEAPEPRGARKAKKPVRRSQKYRVIDKALQEIAESRPRTQEEVFQALEGRSVGFPPAQPFMAARGWMAGFRQHPTAARAWLSKRWAELNLEPLPRGPKK